MHLVWYILHKNALYVCGVYLHPPSGPDGDSRSIVIFGNQPANSACYWWKSSGRILWECDIHASPEELSIISPSSHLFCLSHSHSDMNTGDRHTIDMNTGDHNNIQSTEFLQIKWSDTRRIQIKIWNQVIVAIYKVQSIISSFFRLNGMTLVIESLAVS